MSETKKCPFCAEEIKEEAIFCKYCKTNLIAGNETLKSTNSKQITENKVTCSACGNVWYFGKTESVKNTSNSLHNLGSSMMCCSGCMPALLIPQKEVIDFKRCSKCGSRAVKCEQITHNV